MKCPCCSKEMARGYLYNGQQPVQWIPEGKRPSMLSFTVADDAVPLNNKFLLFKTGGYNAEAYYCDECKIVVAPVSEK